MESKQIRLVKIAREFNVGITTIIEFLKKQGFEIASNPNSKISTELYHKIKEAYGSEIRISGKMSLSNLKPIPHESLNRINLASFRLSSQVCNILNSEFKALIKTCIDFKHFLIDKSIFDLITPENLEKNLTMFNGVLSLCPEFEELLFSSIFLHKPLKEIYHYTTLEACFNILLYGQIRMTSIAALNDRLEGNFSFDPMDQELSGSKKNKYILSCSSGKMKDNLNCWRLYGNDGNGVCIGFRSKNKTPQGFVLGQVFYGNEVYDTIKRIRENLKKHNLDLNFATAFWKSFIKSMDYEYENEIRLFYQDFESKIKKWYLNRNNIPNSFIEFGLDEFPLEISEIWIGPCINEQKIVKFQLEQLFHELYNLRGNHPVNIIISNINHYRRMF